MQRVDGCRTFTRDVGLGQAKLQQWAVHHQRGPEVLDPLVAQDVLGQIQDLQDLQQRLRNRDPDVTTPCSHKVPGHTQHNKHWRLVISDLKVCQFKSLSSHQTLCRDLLSVRKWVWKVGEVLIIIIIMRWLLFLFKMFPLMLKAQNFCFHSQEPH